MYQTLNYLGALGFTYTAVTPLYPGLFVLGIIWAAVAYGLWKIWKKRSGPDEANSPGMAEA